MGVRMPGASFLLKTGVTTVGEFEEVFGRVQKEIRADAFRGMCFLRTVVGMKQEE